ncbi:TonB-dependent receptor [Sphingomonas bacterium]|uniref:TonB-dependent receptor n=1 Tax=Sphingomonas bacterium TaxID=1895847 RepID=UPI00157554E4|nr:TonB-dependent receptor [Sphingomonas bacterium]
MTSLNQAAAVASGLALALASLSRAEAQAGPAPTGAKAAPDSDEVVVTARRQVENLRDVPASITVLTAATLRQAGVVTTEQIVDLTPGVTIVSNAAQVGDAQVNIRGINGARDAENSVALVVDGILKTNTAALNSYQGELQQVEVLKGPQGAYYGRNAAAGALILTTKKPGDRLEVDGKAYYANHDSENVQGSISGPVTDRLGAVLFGNFRHTDGFYRNTGPSPAARGDTVDNYRGWNVGGRLVWTPTDRLEVDAKARYGEVRAGALDYDVVFSLPSFASALGSPKFNEDVNDHKTFTFNRDIAGVDRQRTKEASLRATLDLDWATLSGWGAYSDIDEDFVSDAAAASLGRFNATATCQASTAALFAAGVTLPAPQFLGPTPAASLFGPFGPTTCDGYQYTVRDQRDISTELRLASKSGRPLKWSIGGYYLHINRHFGTAINEDDGAGATRSLYNAPGTLNQTSQDLDDRFRTNVYAGFGSVDYSLATKLTLSAALRYDREERRVTPLSPNAVDPVTGGPVNPGFAVGAIVAKAKTYTQWEPKLAANYKFSDDLSVFADWGIGFKAGGFNSQGSAAIIDQYLNVPLGARISINDDYRSERSSAFEAGFKARALDGALQLDGAVYTTQVHDMQFFEFFTGGFGVLRVVSNIDRVRLTGVEASATYRLIPGWTVFASGNYVDSKIKSNRSRPDTVGNQSPYTARYTINAGTQLLRPLTSRYSGLLRVDYRLTGPTWFHTVQAQSERSVFDLVFPGLGVANYADTRRNAFGIVNLRAGVQTPTLSVTAFAENVFNKTYLSEVIPSPEFGGSFVSPGDRRRIGIELGVNF